MGFTRIVVAQKVCGLVAPLLACIVGNITAQTPMLVARNAEARDSAPTSVAEAEAQGRRFPREVGGRFPRFPVGSRKCTDATVGQSPAEVGDFRVFGFENYAALRQRGDAKLRWWPAFASASNWPPLEITAVWLSDSAVVLRYSQSSMASTHFPATDASVFYAASFLLPHRGPWMVVAHAGVNWGCILVVV